MTESLATSEVFRTVRLPESTASRDLVRTVGRCSTRHMNTGTHPCIVPATRDIPYASRAEMADLEQLRAWHPDTRGLDSTRLLPFSACNEFACRF